MTTEQIHGSKTEELLHLAERYAARNYHPLPVVIAEAEGAWVTDVEGTRYLDMLSAYSALNFGHRHPRLIAAAQRQLERLTLTSRAFQSDTFPVFCRDLAELAGKDMVLTMNTGTEAVETAIKTVRRWGYDVKGVAPGRAKIVTADGNFHGRTITIVGFSSDPSARRGFGPFTPGFVSVPYGDVGALREAIDDDDVVAFLVEPIQGEAGVILPPDGYLRAARELCTDRGVLLVADEIQSGLGRTGATFACQHEDVIPDVYIVGKALGGGIMPLSAVVANRDVLGVFKPGEHGSTFGGNPLACAIGIEVIDMLRTGEFQRRSAELGAWFIGALRDAAVPSITEIRGRGLWVGIDVAPEAGTARDACERLMGRRVLAKDTHHLTIRLAPPLVIEETDLRWAVEQIVEVLSAPQP
jgi:ornithine--oxo-acid transaminase